MNDEFGGPHYDPEMFSHDGKRIVRFHKGGKPPKRRRPPRRHRAPKRKKFKMPHIPIPPPPPPPPPPPSQTSSDVLDADQEARRRAANRTNTGNGTIFGGESGQQSNGLGGNRTILG